MGTETEPMVRSEGVTSVRPFEVSRARPRVQPARLCIVGTQAFQVTFLRCINIWEGHRGKLYVTGAGRLSTPRPATSCTNCATARCVASAPNRHGLQQFNLFPHMTSWRRLRVPSGEREGRARYVSGRGSCGSGRARRRCEYRTISGVSSNVWRLPALAMQPN